MGRIIWYHCPDYLSPPDPEKPMSEAEKKKEQDITLREKRQAVLEERQKEVDMAARTIKEYREK